MLLLLYLAFVMSCMRIKRRGLLTVIENVGLLRSVSNEVVYVVNLMNWVAIFILNIKWYPTPTTMWSIV